MKNYIILENRPELTTEEVIKGIDFSKIKSNAIAAKAIASKSAFFNSSLFKIIIGVVTVSSITSIVYFNSNNSPQQKNRNIVDTLQSDNRIVEKVKLDSFSIKIPLSAGTNTRNPINSQSVNIKSNQPVNTGTTVPFAASINTTITPVTKTDSLPQQKTIPIRNFNPTPNVKCKLWETNSYCDYPKETYFPSPINCNGCEFHYSSCKEITNKNIKAVWITVNNRRIKFKLTTGLENITLQRYSDNTFVSPIGIAFGNKTSDGKSILFLNKDFKTNGFTGQFKQQLDLFILFEEPKIGDKLFIDGFLQAEIK